MSTGSTDRHRQDILLRDHPAVRTGCAKDVRGRQHQNGRVADEAVGPGGSHRKAVEVAIAASWDSGTRFASERYMAHGRPGDGARGQCGATALVVQDLLGGELLVGDVMVGSERLGVHYWNRLEDGEVLDLTGGQFVEDEVVTRARVVHRPPGGPRYGAEAYLLLRERVERLLAADPTEPE